ncbi:MAG: ester cyclase, partial [Anaerolineae bacterium]
MSTEENKTTVNRYLEEVWNAGDVEATDEIIAPAFVFRGPLRTIEGLEAFKQYMAGVRTVFPDIHFTTEDLIAEGDRVVAHWTMTGTQEREFMGIAATGKRFTVPGVSILHLAEGQVAEAQLFWDRL